MGRSKEGRSCQRQGFDQSRRSVNSRVGWGEEVEGDAGSKPLYSRDLSSSSSGPRRVSRAPGSFVDTGERERRLPKQETRGEERERGR